MQHIKEMHLRSLERQSWFNFNVRIATINITDIFLGFLASARVGTMAQEWTPFVALLRILNLHPRFLRCRFHFDGSNLCMAFSRQDTIVDTIRLFEPSPYPEEDMDRRHHGDSSIAQTRSDRSNVQILFFAIATSRDLGCWRESNRSNYLWTCRDPDWNHIAVEVFSQLLVNNLFPHLTFTSFLTNVEFHGSMFKELQQACLRIKSEFPTNQSVFD